jgi:hypothetical protein
MPFPSHNFLSQNNAAILPVIPAETNAPEQKMKLDRQLVVDIGL